MKKITDNLDIIWHFVVITVLAVQGCFAMHFIAAGDLNKGFSCLAGVITVGLGYIACHSFWILKYQRRDNHED